MRELEVQLSKKDILRMMSDMRLKKDGMKESKIQAVMLIIAGISLIYTVGVVLIGGHAPSILWWITDLCAGIGLWLGFAVMITVLIKTVQYFRIIKGPLMHRQLVRFGEHRIEMCTEEGVSCYPYASILYAEKTKHQIMVYMKRIGTVKTLLTLPDSAFTSEAEMDFCLAFLQEKQQQEAFMDPLDQQAEIICPEEQVYTFAFIQEEAEWLAVLTAGKYYMMRTRYALKIPESMTVILSLFLLTGVGILSFMRNRDLVAAAVYGISVILFIGMAYWMFCSRKWIYRGVKRALKHGTGQDWPPGDFLRPVGNQPLYGFGTVEPDLSHDLQGGGEQKRSVYFYERSVFFEYSGLGISDREGKAGGPELLKSARNLRVAEKYIVDISWI